MKLLRSLDKNKGAGCDNVPPIFLVSCAASLSLPITILFRKSLQDCALPVVWKRAQIIPIHKKGSRLQIDNYRPISILNCIGKLFERIVYTNIHPIIAQAVSNTQHGFMPGRSTTSNLAVFTNFVLNEMENGGQVDVVYTDFEKAFDRVDHDILLRKLEMLGIHGDLLRWISSYLSNRSQAVVLGGFRSDYISVPSGVPQGSLLGPLLYNAYIFDIYKYINNSKHVLYLDDKKVYISVRSIADCELLQDDLNSLFNFYKMNRISVSIGKCQCISFTRKKNPIMFTYNFNGVVLERTNVVRDLGIYLDSRMLMRNHINNIADRAFRNLGFIIRTCQPFQCATSYSVVYFAYVRSILEYASPVWSPCYQVYINRLERIQRKFAKHLNFKCKKAEPRGSYVECCRRYNLLTLEERRQLLDMGFLFDVLTGRLDCPELVDLMSRLHVPSRRTRHTCTQLFSVPTHSTNYGMNAVATRILHSYNTSFCNCDPFISNKEAFKNKIKQTILDTLTD